MSVCLCVCVCPRYLSSTIATTVFVRSSSNLECRPHIWKWISSVANNTGSSKRACAPNYFRFSSLLGLSTMTRKAVPRTKMWTCWVRGSKGQELGVGEGDVNSVPPARGSNLKHLGMWKSHQNGEPWKWWFLLTDLMLLTSFLLSRTTE